MTALSLSKVGINGFRGLRHLDLDGLGRINILVGGNNSGKTSVLEALSILCQPYNPHEWREMIYRRDFGGLDETRVQSLRWCFTQAADLSDSDLLVEASCEFECQGEFPLRTLRVRYTEFFGEPSPDEVKRHFRPWRDFPPHFEEVKRGVDLVHFPDWAEFGGSDLDHSQPYVVAYKDPPTLRFWEGLPWTRRGPSETGPKINTKTLTPCSYQINRDQVIFYSRQVFQQDFPNIPELLRDFDNDIESIELASMRGDRPAIYIKHKRLGIAPLSIFGDATRRAVLLASTLLSLKDGGVLLIDEVEAGIHFGALGRVFEWLVKAAQSLRVQVFITTHSLEALDAMLAARSKLGGVDIVAFHLDQTPEITRAKRFPGALLHRLRFERGLDVR